MTKKLLFFLSLVTSFLLASFSFCFADSSKYITSSPVVQIVSYYDQYGKYPIMLGWGSASVITDDGVIISNNHVVDSGDGSLASAFSICLTQHNSKELKCDYTASLIDRDEKMDISILKIDPVDIYGNDVDYSKFMTIEIDYDYLPKSQDDVIAIGYPWVGANTISETKGIVSGDIEYNGYNYIKTDTLIAGGNSGGALVRNGKLVGIPTFTIGFGDSLGYALDIKEAKEFIETNKIKKSKENLISKLINFKNFKKTIEQINSKSKISDDLFEIDFSKDYQVSNYINNYYVNITQKNQKDSLLTKFTLGITKAPKLESDKKLFYYFETQGFYDKNYYKLLKKEISGINFYTPVLKNDLSAGDYFSAKYYAAYVNGYFVTITVEAPFYDEKLGDELNKELDDFLSKINLKTKYFSKWNFKFDYNIPKIEIKNFAKSLPNLSEYKIYLGDNLYEYLSFTINELDEYSGKGKTAKEIYDSQMKDIDKSKKAMIKFNGLNGFIDCSDSLYGNDYFSNYIDYDEKGNSIDISSCEIVVIFPFDENLNRHNYLSAKIYSLKNHKTLYFDILIAFMKQFVDVGTSGETDIKNILKESNKFKFKDLGVQSSQYKNFISLLLRYDMIEDGNYFNGDKIITWGEFLYMYFKWVYKYDLETNKCSDKNYSCIFSSTTVEIDGKSISLDSIFKGLGIISYDEYINEETITEFSEIIDFVLAGVIDLKTTYSKYAEIYNLFDEDKYSKKKSKFETFINSIYGNKKILIGDFYSDYDTFFYSNYNYKYYPSLDKIVSEEIYENEEINFGTDLQSRSQIEYSELVHKYNCIEKKSYDEFITCKRELNKKLLNISNKYGEYQNLYGYYVLRKADAIEYIFTRVDFGLYDDELAEKKDTIVE